MFLKFSFKTTVLSLLFIIVSLFVAHSKALAAQNWQAHAGTGIAGVAVMKFYPQTITIDEGDSITWTVSGDAHTISFLSGEPAPSPFDPEAQQPKGGPTYDGSGFTNSGALFPGQSYSLIFSKAGTYTYQCLFHPSMTATVIVQPTGTPYPLSQSNITISFMLEHASDLSDGFGLYGNTFKTNPIQNSDASKRYFVTAGVGNDTESIMRFFPKMAVIEEGDSITWTNHDSMLPHTVSFASANGTIPESFDPAGGSTYNGSIFTSSGILLPSQTYTLKFTKAGKYNYECLLHDEFGMEASVIVIQK